MAVAQAQTSQQQQQGGGLTLAVSSQLAYDDNVLRQGDAQLGSRMLQVNPKLRYQVTVGTGNYFVSYDLNHVGYLDSTKDTTTNQTLSAGVEERINRTNKLQLEMGYNYAFEPRGVGFNEGANALSLSKPTAMVTQDVSVKYQLGQDNRGLRLLFGAGRRITDRNSPLILNDSRDFAETNYSMQVDYRVASRTDLVAEYRYHEVSYPRMPTDTSGRLTPLDSYEEQYLVGLDLEATAKTTGKLRVGTSSRDFKWKVAQWDDGTQTGTGTPAPVLAQANSRKDDLFWEFAAVWAPRTYSRFEFNTRTTSRETQGVGTFVRGKDYAFLWTHQWNSRIRTRLDLTFGSDTYIDTARVDERRTVNIRMEYDFSKKINFGLGYTFQDLRSTFERADFEKSVYFIFASYRNR